MSKGVSLVLSYTNDYIAPTTPTPEGAKNETPPPKGAKATITTMALGIVISQTNFFEV
jgi:hypothetical protein